MTALGPNETAITFSELDRYSEVIEIENDLLVPIASLDDVIRMKEVADRVKDHQALPESRQLRATSTRSVHETSIRFKTCEPD